MISAETTIEELYRLGLISARAMNVCRSGEIKTLFQLLKIERYYLQRIKNCGLKTLEELFKIRKRYKHYLKDNGTDTAEESISIEEIELIDAKRKIELLSPNSVVQLKGWLTRKYNELSKRARNAFPQLSDLQSVLDTIYTSRKFNAEYSKNIGRKTSREIQQFLDETKAYFEDITKEIDPSVDSPKYNEFDWTVVELSELYPFLLTTECNEVAKFLIKYDHIPFLFIARQYILKSEQPRMNIYREYYGFNPEGKRYSLTEIGERNNLSKERIRQLVNKRIILPKSLEDEIRKYLTPLMRNIIPFDSRIWNKIQCENMLEGAYSQTAHLVCSLTDSHTIVQIDENDKEYLVKKSLLENVKIRNVLSNIIRVVGLRRTTIEQLDIIEYIRAENRVYHKDVDQLSIIYANFLKKTFGVDIDDDRYVMMLPNTLDISIAVEDILAQSGEPMSLDEILQAFNILHPSRFLDDASKLKSYIIRNKNIKPKGKTGIYILKSWENHFTGTLTGYLEHILKTLNEPIPLDDLVDYALEEFPKSNRKSIYSLLVGDKKGRFVLYEDNYIGLADNSILEIELKERRIIKRHTFDVRFDELRKFITSRKRLPIQTGTEEEKSLARWINNVIKSNIGTTEEQVLSLQTFLSENRTIPQNGIEYNFKQMCDEIKVMVAKSFTLPTPSDNIREYSWLKKNLEKYVTYEDNRKVYFEDLLNFLKDFGFYF